jgi:hypothetical protein
LCEFNQVGLAVSRGYGYGLARMSCIHFVPEAFEIADLNSVYFCDDASGRKPCSECRRALEYRGHHDAALWLAENFQAFF